MWELKRFHRKSLQAFHAERIVMFTARDAISGRYFPTITLFTLTLQISDVFQLQKGHPGGAGLNVRQDISYLGPGHRTQTWDLKGKPSPHLETFPPAVWSWDQAGSAGAAPNMFHTNQTRSVQTNNLNGLKIKGVLTGTVPVADGQGFWHYEQVGH